MLEKCLAHNEDSINISYQYQLCSTEKRGVLGAQVKVGNHQSCHGDSWLLVRQKEVITSAGPRK